MTPRFSLMTRLNEEGTGSNIISRPPHITGVDFPRVEEKPLHYTVNEYGINKTIKVDGSRALINPDTGNMYSIVSDRYQTIPYRDSLEMVEDAIQNNSEFGTFERTVDFMQGGGRMLAKYRFTDHLIPIGDDNDLVNPEIYVRRSYDTTWGFVLLFGAFRWVCSNGLVVGEKVLNYKHKHTTGLNQNSLLEDLKGSMDKFAVQADIWRTWLDRMTTPNDYERVMGTLEFGKNHTEAIEREVEVSSNVTMEDVRTKTLSYWLFFNVLSQYITHKVESPVRREYFFDRMRSAFRK